MKKRHFYLSADWDKNGRWEVANELSELYRVIDELHEKLKKAGAEEGILLPPGPVTQPVRVSLPVEFHQPACGCDVNYNGAHFQDCRLRRRRAR